MHITIAGKHTRSHDLGDEVYLGLWRVRGRLCVDYPVVVELADVGVLQVLEHLQPPQQLFSVSEFMCVCMYVCVSE